MGDLSRGPGEQGGMRLGRTRAGGGHGEGRECLKDSVVGLDRRPEVGEGDEVVAAENPRRVEQDLCRPSVAQDLRPTRSEGPTGPRASAPALGVHGAGNPGEKAVGMGVQRARPAADGRQVPTEGVKDHLLVRACRHHDRAEVDDRHPARVPAATLGQALGSTAGDPGGTTSGIQSTYVLPAGRFDYASDQDYSKARLPLRQRGMRAKIHFRERRGRRRAAYPGMRC